jgi:FtsP/CotA-like multicopper oxidase with cupredoxin domain
MGHSRKDNALGSPSRTAALATLLVLAGASSCDKTTPVAAPPTAAVDELREPPVFASAHGVLDLLVIAKATTLSQFSPYQPTGWVYEICARTSDDARSCPALPAPGDLYGGARLQLSPGDLLKIRLINQLPRNPAVYDPASGDAFLALNPTNLHTHGMLVSPRYATSADPTWGDNVFIYNFNSENGAPDSDSNLHGTALFDAVDYSITIPASHPSGLYWFHPHVHGISAQQISAGLSGIITVGQVSDYALTRAPRGADPSDTLPIRHLILKDTQVLENGTMLLSQDAGFCAPSSDDPRRGGCAGAVPPYPTQFDYRGGRWFFTINGQQFPTITVDTPAGQIWRIVNASANATYHLSLWDPTSNREMLLRVISIDGVGIDVGPETDPSLLNSQAGQRFQAVPCPDANAAPAVGVCTTALHLMPSSRAEVWVSYRNGNGALEMAPRDTAAVLRTSGHMSGPQGPNWPAVDLATVVFAQTPGSPQVLVAAPQVLVNAPQARAHAIAGSVSADLREANAAVPSDPTCTALAPGHMRRIFFGTTPQPPHALGLGYEELDAQGATVPGTFIDIAPFDPSTPTVCIALGSDNQPTTERWQLVNIMASDHNFHIHQTHFSVLDAAEVAGTAIPATLRQGAVMMDSLPLLHAEGMCASVSDWRAGSCTAYPATVEITFAVAGDFVYHCHIGAHEDAGMMAVIRVRSDPFHQSPTLTDRLLSAIGFPKDDPTQPLTPRIAGPMCRGDPRRSSQAWVAPQSP